VTVRKMVIFLGCYLYSVLCCLFLFGGGFLWGKNRSLIYKIAAHFGPFDLSLVKPKPLIPKVRSSELLVCGEGVRIMEPRTVDGNVTPLELIIIDQLIRRYRPERLFEIGTFDGRTTLNMAANTSDHARVYTLDLPRAGLHTTKLEIVPWECSYIDKEAPGARFMRTEYRRKITQLYGDSARFDFSPFVNQMDLVFVDGSHSYAYVLNDSMRALELLRNKCGVILWHDYDAWEGVTEALNELYKEKPEFKQLKHIEGTTLVCLIPD
jgi:hypothetical protein